MQSVLEGRTEDPKSTVSYFYCVREMDMDREVKKQLLEESGLVDKLRTCLGLLLRIHFPKSQMTCEVKGDSKFDSLKDSSALMMVQWRKLIYLR